MINIQAVLDENGYIQSYGYIDSNSEYIMSDSYIVNVDENYAAFEYIYDCYKLINDVIELDKVKVESTYIDNSKPALTEVDVLRLEVEELKKIIAGMVGGK